jgi:hypothetical protein
MILFLCSSNIDFHRESTDDGLQTEIHMQITNKSEQVLIVMNYSKVQNVVLRDQHTNCRVSLLQVLFNLYLPYTALLLWCMV